MARRRIVPVFVPHLGCTYRCVFCDQQKITGRADLAKSARDEIHRALESLQGQPGELAFYGGSFTAIPVGQQEALLQTAQGFLKENRENGLRVSTRPDAVTCEALERLCRYGVKTVELGVQSMDREVLQSSGRPVDPDCVEPAVELLRQFDMQVILQMMTGLPGDTEDKSVDTAKSLIRLSPDGVRIYPTVIIRGTPLEAMYLRGEYREHTVEAAVSLSAKLLPMFWEAGIPVIRLGLNPTEELSGGEVVAGAYHPALGQLVHSRIYYRAAAELAADFCGFRKLVLGVFPSHISTMIGQRRENVKRLQRELSIGEVIVRGADAKPFEPLIISAK